jgi:hypothetical protein
MQLLQIEVSGIQQFIFESNRLREWRGASALLSRMDHQVLDDVIAGTPVEKIRSGGGVAVLRVPSDAPDETADRVEETLARRYRDEAAGVPVHAARVEGSGVPVLELMDRLALKAATERERAPVVDGGAARLGPMVRFCDSCGRRAAEEHRTLGQEEGELLCRRCFEKGRHGLRVRRGVADGSILDRFARALGDRSGWPAPDAVPGCVPDDLEALAEADPNGKIALIQADGNALGRTIQQIDQLEAYREFSDGVAGAVETAVFDTLAEHPPRDGTLPWEVVFLGGDDVLLFTTASIALPVAQELAERVAGETASLMAPYGRDHLSLGTGIAAADPHVPASVLLELAGDLESSAKDLAYAQDGDVSTVDYHRITGEGATTLHHIRDETLRPSRDYRAAGDGAPSRAPTRLTARPFTTDQLASVRAVATAWEEAGLSRSKLHRLREALFESPAEAIRTWTHVVARASDDERPAWRRLQSLAPEGESTQKLPWAAPSTSAAPDVRRKTYLLDILDALALR